MGQNLIESANKILLEGGLVIFPTETVYGIGANATDLKAVNLIYTMKKRPKSSPIICHFATIKNIKKNFYLNDVDLSLAKKFWPGPLTLILKKKSNSKISSIVSNNSEWVGCRIPNNEIALNLLKRVKFPIAAPSANINMKTSVTLPDDLDPVLKKEIFTIDDGSSILGLESTVIKTSNNKIEILRLGSLTEEEIYKKFKNYKITISKKSTLSPGHQRKHYSPKKPLRINVNKIKNDEGLLNFGLNNLKSKIINLNLSKKSDLIEASNKFYHYLNLIDNSNCKTIAVAPIPSEGLGKVINDRLMKAIVE
tara:strand:+ start:1959 stop:2885 length:927 start_codon:yes stop_codon:yes gene_type:complete